MPASDQELVRAALAGEREAFGELVGRHQRPLYNAAYRILGNRDDAQDAVQNALVRIHRNLDRYDPARPFRSWALRISVNEALRVVERRPAERPEGLSGEDSASLEVAADAGQPGRVRAAEIRDRLQSALLGISAEQRAVLVLRHFQELSYREIAEIVGVAEKTVKSRLFEARRALREELLRSGVLR